MQRVDIAQTINNIDFPEEIWEWLDLLGEVVGVSQQEALIQDDVYWADTPFKHVLLRATNKDLNTLSAIYILLRAELFHQAASHVRLFCESLITLSYIAQEPEKRSESFFAYSDIEVYNFTKNLLKWEKDTANPKHVERIETELKTVQEKYTMSVSRFSFFDKKGKQRPFQNWCNKSIANQAKDCGNHIFRLYEVAYKFLSSYIHSSAWSLNRQLSYSREHYNSNIVHQDIAHITRVTFAIWAEWCKFCDRNLNWHISHKAERLTKKLEELETKHFSI